jgi:uncharacterized protein
MAQFGKRGVVHANARSARVARHMTAVTPEYAAAPAANASFDEGLRAYMLGIYNLMFLGIAFSGAIAAVLITTPELLESMLANPLFPLTIFLGTFALSWCSPMIIESGSAAVGHIFFWPYCALWGAGLAPMLAFLIQEDMSQIIITSFFLAASLFGAASIYGYTTRRSLCDWGAYLCMLCFGLLAASILNLLVFEFNGLCFLICVATVIIFTAVTAWETQMIKDHYGQLGSAEQQEAFAIFGAFQLYGSFMVIFSRLLRIMYRLQGD